jgi:Recombination endonuclease VII
MNKKYFTKTARLAAFAKRRRERYATDAKYRARVLKCGRASHVRCGHRFSRYGITEDMFNRMRKIQKYKCYLCGKRRKLKIDHKVGVRGLLCQGCNVRLGWFERRQQEIMNYINRDAVTALVLYEQQQ